MQTFVLRVFAPADEQRRPLTGVVECVSSGRKEVFASGAELLEIVGEELAVHDAADSAAPKGK